MNDPKALHVTTFSEREVLVTRVFDAPRELVFEAWTTCEHLKRWMLGPDGWTMPICEIDLRPGGAYRFVWRRPERPDMEITGEYREIVRPARLVSTECWGGEWPEALNALVLTEDEGRTTASLTISYPSKAARDGALRTGMTDGMEQAYRRLDAYLSSVER